ncbi:MAG: hypothetical protein MMC23_006338 [Stictis urceolatum]|nr:hypothetical protein [Stictis urceolata]
MDGCEFVIPLALALLRTLELTDKTTHASHKRLTALMPGRKYTVLEAQTKDQKKPKNRSRVLNAFSIAEQETPSRTKIRKNRLGEVEELGRKRGRDDHPEPAVEEDGARNSKRLKRGDKDRFGQEVEGGSDSEGNEWVTGHVDEDDDSELDSDEAMGDSDSEVYEGFSLRESSNRKSTKRKATLPSRNAGMPENINMNENYDDIIGEPVSDDESDKFAAEAVDLADVLDERDTESEDETSAVGQSLPASRPIPGNDDSDGPNDASELSQSDGEEDGSDPAKLSALRDLVSSLSTGKTSSAPRDGFGDAQEAAAPSEYGVNPTQKLAITDLLPTITDPALRKSLRSLMDDGKQNRSRTGLAQKLDVPLAKRQQDRIDRSVAFEKSKDTLSRWIDTVKRNRRAEHLQFPLKDPDVESAKNVNKLRPTSQSQPMTDLETTIQNILVESGMASANGNLEEGQIQAFEDWAAKKMPIEEVQARRAELRRARELLFREERKAKRIKSIKSKAYRRVHRKERERNLLREQEAHEAAGIEPSEDEQEPMHRRRAEERMGAKHRESKWAKAMKGTGRARWDEGARAGITEMARREEELRKRIQGKNIHTTEFHESESESDDEGASSEEDEEGFAKRMKGRLENLKQSESASTGLASLKFMQNAEKARKARNDEDIERLQRELSGKDSFDGESDVEDETTGRRLYGPTAEIPISRMPPQHTLGEFEEGLGPEDETNSAKADVANASKGQTLRSQREFANPKHPSNGLSSETLPKQSPRHDEDPWLNPQKQHSREDENAWINPKRRSSKPIYSSDAVVIVNQDSSESQPPSLKRMPDKASRARKTKAKTSLITVDDRDSDQEAIDPSHPEPEFSNPLTTDRSLIHQAFASDAALTATSFAAEKSALADEEAPQDTAPTALPGWGTWVGEGLSKATRKSNVRHNRSFSQYNSARNKLSEGVPSKQRKDRKLDKVIVSEKRVPKTAKYLASQLPHTFETKAQYERSLRMPVGPEWSTKEVFQTQTRPRVLMKGGVITPMKKPLV